MVATDFLDYLSKYNAVQYVGVEDFADKMNFLFTVIIFMLSAAIISVKEYLFTSIECYIPTTPSGADFDPYLKNYCWVHGTIPLLASEETPSNPEAWAELDRTRRINYYQWVPFMLGLQCILFYLPRVFWQIICYNRTGTDLEHIINTASKASQSGSDRKALVDYVATNLEDLFFQHRDFRVGRIADLRRKAYSMCSFCVVSKRLGTWLVFTYFVIKIFYLVNCIGQLFLMQRFLGYNGTMGAFGIELASKVSSGVDWDETLIFPRVAFCYVPNIRHAGASNSYMAQCALPVNMLNEKIYIFLWFWVVIVAFLTLVSIPAWFVRMATVKNRAAFVKKYLRIKNDYGKTEDERQMLKRYIREFLRHDGVFLLRMLSINAGDLVTSEIVQELWHIYKDKYRDRNMVNDTGSVCVHLDEQHKSLSVRHRGPNGEKYPLKGEEYV